MLTHLRSIPAACLVTVASFFVCSPRLLAADQDEMQPVTGPNLVVNGGFEKGMEGWGWSAINGARASGEVVSDQHHTGRHSFRLTNASALAPNVFGRVFQTVGGLQPYTTYRISAWCKGEGAGIVWLGGGPGWFLRAALPRGDFDWQPMSTEFTTGPAAEAFELMILTESETKAVWVDDVEMVPVRANLGKRAEVARAMKDRIAEQESHLARVERIAASQPELKGDRYIELGETIAKRFLRRAREGGPGGKDGSAWTSLQLVEVGEVLDKVEQLIQRQHRNGPLPGGAAPPVPGEGRPSLRNGVFTIHTTRDRSRKDRGTRPYYFAGYGHFGQVAADIPNFSRLGVSLIQQERGPSTMDPIGALTPAARSILDTLRRAARSHVWVDLLLSPHYFPDWAVKEAPDVLNGNPGFIGYNIDHPRAREVIREFIDAIVPLVRREPALFSLCLSNEPVYDSSGRDPYSRPLWTAYLRQRHGTIQALNRLYGSHYARFEDAPPPPIGMPAAVEARRAYYDWVRFNQQHFADWHRWMNDLIKAKAPELRTHAKAMVFYTFDRNQLHFGVDPEEFCEATDIAGCDDYAFPNGPHTYNWQDDEMYYDLLHSFRNQPVFNSENHLIPDGSPPDPVPPEQTRAALWQGALHHQGATTIWVWEENGGSGLGGSIYFRPANTFAAGRAMLDLDRLAPEVAAIDRAAPEAALLYSMASNFWQPDYGSTVSRLYRLLAFRGHPATFVSEKQLQEGRVPPGLRCIVLPRATHTGDQTAAAIARLALKGVRVIRAGEENLAFDEYHRPRELPAGLQNSPVLDLKLDDAALSDRLAALLPEDQGSSVELLQAGQPTSGIEYRTVRQGRRVLAPLINFLGTTSTVQLRLAGPHGPARDLLTGDRVDLSQIRLAPMTPLLLEIPVP